MRDTTDEEAGADTPDDNEDDDVDEEEVATARPHGLTRRKNYCPYCKRLISNYSRHLVSQHPHEEDVSSYIALGDKSPRSRKKQRAAATDKIRHRGNGIFNEEIAAGLRRDDLIPARRPSKRGRPVDNVSHVSCRHCSGLFDRKLLFKHLPNCVAVKASSSAVTIGPLKGVRTVLSQHARQLIRVSEHASRILKDEVFPKMQKDELTAVAQSDDLICKFGSEFRNTHRGLKQIAYCSSRLRTLARVYLDMKKEIPDHIERFSDCFAPKHFDLLVRAVRDFCKYDERGGLIKTPSVTPRLCASLKRCANILKSDAIKSETMSRESITETVYQLNNFLHLMEKDWNANVGAISEISRRRRKVVKRDLLPDPDDIRTFSQYIHELCPRYVFELENVPTVKNYERLAKLIISHIITLNRRRPNETVEILTAEYRETLDIRTDYGADSQNVVTAEEMESTKDLVIFYVAANKNLKKVPVLLTRVFHRALDVLLASQERVGVKTKYAFGRPGNNELFDGSAVLREIAAKAGLKSPALFTANALRHHAATSSQLQSRDDTYTKRLSKFMGHDLQTHEHFYEMPLPLVQKTKVGHKLLQMIRPKSGAETTKTTCTVTSATVTAATTATTTTTSNASLETDVCPLVSVDSPPSPQQCPDSPPSPQSHLRIDRAARPSTLTSCTTEFPSTSTAFAPTDTPVRPSKRLRSEACGTPTTAIPSRRSRKKNDSASPFSGGTTSSSIASDTPPRKAVCRRRRWTAAEKSAIYEAFGQQFVMKMKPNRSEIKSLWEKEPSLKDRTLEQTVTYVNNIVTGKHHIPTPTRKKMKSMVVKGKTHLSP